MKIRPGLVAVCITLLVLISLVFTKTKRKEVVQEVADVPATVEEQPQHLSVSLSDPSTQTSQVVVVSETKVVRVDGTPSFFPSSTTVPESLKEPRVGLVISNCVALNSRAAYMMSLARSEPYDPPSIGDGVSNPTDEQITARSDYDFAFNQRKAKSLQERKALKAQAEASFREAREAWSKLPEIIGDAYTDYRQWSMAEKANAVLQGTLSKQERKVVAMQIAKLWSEGHSAVVIFDSIPAIKEIEDIEIKKYFFAELDNRR